MHLLNYQIIGRKSISHHPPPSSGSHTVYGVDDPASVGVSIPLGNTAKSRLGQAVPPLDEGHVYRRLQRFALQSQVASYLPDQRVSSCLRKPVGSHVEIKHNLQKDTFGYRKLETCASVWMCPVCAAKISEKRRSELATGISNWHDQSGSVVMMTITVQHNLKTPFKKTLAELQTAYESFLRSKPVKRLLDQMGVVGRIRALETTYGENGWHPHFHVLMFVNSDDKQLLRFENALLNEWKVVCKRKGMSTPNGHGLKLHDGSYAAAYVSKWGLESEMTKGHIKKSKTGYSPFDLARFDLGLYAGAAKPLSPGQARMLFREYAHCMKGKRQLVWSDGLRDLLGLKVEKSDKELVDEVEDLEVLFVSIPLAMWKIIIREEQRGQVLESCKLGIANFYACCKKIYLKEHICVIPSS
jgi:hypothetical protein